MEWLEKDRTKKNEKGGRSRRQSGKSVRCCALISKGGLNVVHFSTKCVSLCLSNFLSLRDDFGLEKWHYLARYFLSNRLAKFDKKNQNPKNFC